MKTENSEDHTDHEMEEMEEILRGAGLETRPEFDKQVLADAARTLPPTWLPRLLKVAAAAMVLFCCGALYISWGASRETMEPLHTSQAQDGAQLYVTNYSSSEPVVLDIGTALGGTLEREPNTGGTGGGAGTTTLYYLGGRGGAGAGGSIQIEAGPPAARFPGQDINLVPSGGLGFGFGQKGKPAGPRLPRGTIRLLPSKAGVGVYAGFIDDGDEILEIHSENQVDSERWNRLKERYDGEEYDRRIAIPFLDPRRAPLSTFSVDVDTASYANIRRFLQGGQLPPADAVRIEEMINYFSYDYPQPEGDRPFSVVADAAECPWNPKFRLVRIGVQGRRIAQEKVPPRNLVFLLDVSGSMKSEDKLPLVKSAMKLLVGELRPEDRVAIVTYASGTNVVLEPTTGDERFRIIGAIDRLTAAGSTDAGSGIQLAYEMARRHFERGAINRVLLATDGDFNVGITDRAALEALITKERDDGIFLTVLGVGTGNLKDSQMEMLADKGNGNYAYLDSILEAQKVLVHEAGATLVTIAKDVKIQVEFNPARVAAYRLVGYENRMLAARDFNDDTKDAGEIGAGHSVTALYEVIPAGVAVPQPTVDPLRYQQPDADAEPVVNEDFGEEMLFLRLRYKEPDGAESKLLEFPLTDPGAVSINEADDDFAFAAAVAVFGKILQGSPDTRALALGLVEEIAAGAVGADANGYRREFLELVKAASKLGR